VFALIAFGGHAWAWGDEGHKVVCEMAYRLAAPETRAEIRRLLQADSQFDLFNESCTWPDHPRKRAAEHFINLQRDANGLTSDQCPTSSMRTLTVIESDTAVLSSGARDADKLASLKFLGHWVGDIHQPLHVSFEDDRGGNGISVNGE
jgi:hypothetical protein